VRRAIEELIDVDRWNKQAAIQEVELKSIAHFAEQVRGLPQAPQP
jgi:hypothetical protein